MSRQERKRPPRIPLTPEELAQLVSLKKRIAANKLAAFKRSELYKFCNIFNICCFFIYWELLLCFFGPCHYQTHYSKAMRVKRGDGVNNMGKRLIAEVNVTGVNEEYHTFIVNDFIDAPKKQSAYQIGKDYILQKELKGTLGNSEPYRLLAASPLIFLSAFIIVVSFISFFYNLNENPDSLRAVAILNVLTLLAFLAI